MKKKYSFANAKPVPFGKIDYWFRVGQCGCHKTDYKPNLMDKRKFMAELRRDSNIMIKHSEYGKESIDPIRQQAVVRYDCGRRKDRGVSGDKAVLGIPTCKPASRRRRSAF